MRDWSGEPVNHSGRHFQVRRHPAARFGTTTPSTCVDRWLLAAPPADPSIRPVGRRGSPFLTARHGHAPSVDEVRDLVGYVHQLRPGEPDDRFQIVLGGASLADRGKARDLIGPLVDAGATWWDERQLQTSDDVQRLAPAITAAHHQGPPSL